jgi:rhamnosyltransferase subunit B
MLASLPNFQEAFAVAGTRFDLVVTSSFSLAAASLAEAAKIPRLTLHFQPICLRSEFDCPLFLPELFWLDHMPRWVKRTFFSFIDFTFWTKVARPLNAFRFKLGLPPLRDFYDEAVNGAAGVAALFPDWFAPPQPDWPRHLRQYSFPTSHTSRPLPQDLERFLEAEKPPVVWTHGSANFFVRDFQGCALRVSQELGLRCILVSLEPPAIQLPEWAIHCDHVRFEDLFPRCAAAVHHGGIGTTAKCVAAGIPQLIIPRSHDQPDNARRIARLGLGDTVSYRRIEGHHVARTLQNILKSPSVAERCREFQKRMAATDPLTPLCDWAEEIARKLP